MSDRSGVKAGEISIENGHLSDLKMGDCGKIFDGNKRMAIELKTENFLVRIRPYFKYIHLGMFVLFLLMYLIPPFLDLPVDDATVLNNYFLMVKFAVWGLWFPLLLFSIIIFGRAWCGIFCPQGAMAEQFNKKGMNRALPKWIKWEGTPIVSFIIITILGQMIGVRDYPKPMLLIFGGTTVIAGIVGYRYTRGGRAWCRHLCPVGILLGIFSRLGMVGIEKGKSKGTKVLCPTYINLSTKASARHCIECMRCVNPGKEGSLMVRLRKPGSEIEKIRNHNPHIYEVIFLFLATGLALGGFHWITNPYYIQYKMFLGEKMLSMNLHQIIGSRPQWWLGINYPAAGEVFNYLDIISIASFMTLFMLVIGGILFLLTLASSALIDERGKKLIEKVAIFGYIYAPVALLSLILGLGADLFSLFDLIGLSGGTIKGVKFSLLLVGVLWSLHLNYQLIKDNFMALIPNSIGILIVMAAWYPVI